MTLVFIKLLPFRLELASNGDMNELENHSMGSVSPRSPLHSHSRSASDDLKEKLINDTDKTQNIVINEIVIDKDTQKSRGYGYVQYVDEDSANKAIAVTP